jgi:tyrosine-specific transport protein
MKNTIYFLQAIAIMIGTIIGAGVLGVPFVFAKAGFLTGSLVLLILTLAMIIMKLMFGEVTLRTYGKHQLSGYVEKYLGKFWKKINTVFLLITISGSLLAYFIGVGEVLAATLGGMEIVWSLTFYMVASLLLFIGLNAIKKIEFILSFFILLIILIIFFISLGSINNINITVFDFSKLLIPYGVILFACSGIVSIPEIREILWRKEKMMKKSIVVGALTPSVIYFIFALSVVGVSGINTTEVATIGLGQALGKEVLLIGNIFAFLAMSTSFLTLGLALKEVYNYDFKISHLWSWALTIALPLIIYMMGINDFIEILGLVGAIGFGVNGVMYIFTYWGARKKGKRQPEYTLKRWITLPASILLVVVFVGGLLYTIWETFLA